MSRFKLYALMSAACATGYSWLAYICHQRVIHCNEPGVCIFRRLTTIPCPSCGSTRSVLSLLHGEFREAMLWNPFGFLLMAFLVVAPFWISYDLASRNSTLLNAYIKIELLLKRKWIALPAVLLVLMNWIWNISKGL